MNDVFRPLPVRRWLCLVLPLAALARAIPAGAADEKSFTQEPVVAESQVRPAGDDAPERLAELDLSGGPDVQWIWGRKSPGERDRFVFRREFSGGSEAAALIATCDNRMTLYLNGRKIAENIAWETPVRMDVQKYLREDRNVLLVEAANRGGPAGLALKLALTMPGGERKYVVTDESWQAARNRNAEDWKAAHALETMGGGPWGDLFGQQEAALPEPPRNVFQVLPGFQVERLYTVPRERQGSWVAMTFDGQGRILASDQEDKGLYRITPPPLGSQEPTRVERLDVDITAAQGMVFAFDSLYLSVNGGPGSGLYRARDTDGDDQFDEVKLLKPFRGGGEHGPHAVRLSPDGKSLFVVAGNHTDPPDSFVPRPVPGNWDEDLLLPRQWDARGHARGRLAPGGWIARTDPEGEVWEMFSIGYRNAYDMAFNADGELFTYDSDMEWDMGTPWYRPTRVVHATSGSEFGWRSGTGKWPSYYVDSLPELIDIGPGSPVGVTFGYGAAFPAKYQKALYLLDWTFGTIYALHLEPAGASYRGVKEEFLSRTPLPLTDAEIGPDGALYFTTGGRGTQSELFRVTYVGEESTAPASAENEAFADLRELRRRLESLHGGSEMAAPPEALDFIWAHLGHEDRHIRYAARIALEHWPAAGWQDRALAESDPQTLVPAIVALARQGDPSLQPAALAALARLEFGSLAEPLQLDLLRAYSLVFIRMGAPDQSTAAEIAARLDEHYPAETNPLNRELCSLLVYLQSPTVITKTLALMEREYERDEAEMAELLARNPGYGGPIAQMLANQPEIEKIHYAFALRNVRYGWTLEQRQAYFAWFAPARQRSGGASYEGFLDNIRDEALANVSAAERTALESAVDVAPPKPAELPKPHGPGRQWTLEDLAERAKNGLAGRDFENGRRAYAAARCIVCHRFDGQGGATGPDLTNLAGRFGFRDLAEAIVDPSKDISDQYRAHSIVTAKGEVITGRITAEQDGKLTVLVDPEDASKIAEIAEEDIEELLPSQTSLMPADLLNPLNEDEVLDLLAYLMSRGNPEDRMFARPAP